MAGVAWRLLGAAALVAALTACGTSNVKDNADTVCPPLLGLQDDVVAASGLFNPDVTLEQAGSSLSSAAAKSQAVRTSMTASQLELLDRFDRTVKEYAGAIATRDQASTYQQNAFGLDAYRSSMFAAYKTMLEKIGCTIPPLFVKPSPSLTSPAPPPASAESSPSESPSSDQSASDSGSNGQ